MCIIRGSFIERVTQVFEVVYLFHFLSVPVTLILFTLPVSLIEHHHFRLFNIHSVFSSSHTFPGSSSCLSFLFNSLPQLPSLLQTPGFKLFLNHTPPPLVLSLTFHPFISATYIVNSRGLAGSPVSLFLSSQTIRLLSLPPSLCFLFLRISPQSSVATIRLFLPISLYLPLLHSNILLIILSRIYLYDLLEA
jgi:hypothetical protein